MMMNFIITNVRGSNSASFRRHCEALVKTNKPTLVKTHKPTLLVLLETKKTEHKHLTEALNFDTHIQSPVNGLSSGIVIIWKEDLLKLDSISITA